MKALLNCAFFLLLSTIVNGQVRNLVTDRIYIRDSFRLKDKSIYQISTDATFSSANNKSLASQKAIKDYVQNQIGNIDSLVKAANASGLFTAGHIPYIDATGRMAARGFVEFGAMSAPSTPGAGVRVFADASNRLSWKGVDGYVRSWNGTLTADRLYKLQNKSYTLADSADVAGLSSVYFPLVGGAITGTGGAGFVGLPVQSSAPGTPGSGVRVFADASNRLSWKGVDGYVRSWNGAITADRLYKLQNKSYTLADSADVAGLSSSYFPLVGGALAGTGGNGFVGFPVQSSAPSAPGGGFRLYANSSGAFSWRGANGFIRAFDGLSNTGDRTYTLQNSSGTLALLEATQTWSGASNTFSNLVGIGVSPVGQLNLGGSLSLASWLTSGIGLRYNAATYTNTTSTGAIASEVAHSFAQPTFASSNVIAVTNASTVFIAGPPIAGTNTTLPTTWALRLETGNLYIGGNFTANGSSTINGGSVNLNIGNAGGYPQLSLNGRGAVLEDGPSRLALGRGYSQVVFNVGNMSGSNGAMQIATASDIRMFEASGTAVHRFQTTGVVFGSATIDGSAFLEIVSTTRGFLPPRATDAQISSISTPAMALQVFSTTTERINVKRTGGFFQLAYIQDVKRDTSYKVVNQNLDISGQTTNFKNRYHTVRISTAVTVAATGNNVITMPVPSVDLLGVQFKFYITDVSGDGDISQISFGTDGVDGYLSNGDATYQSTFNLFSGFDVDVSVNWDENKGAYRWFLR